MFWEQRGATTGTMADLVMCAMDAVEGQLGLGGSVGREIRQSGCLGGSCMGLDRDATIES